MVLCKLITFSVNSMIHFLSPTEIFHSVIIDRQDSTTLLCDSLLHGYVTFRHIFSFTKMTPPFNSSTVEFCVLSIPSILWYLVYATWIHKKIFFCTSSHTIIIPFPCSRWLLLCISGLHVKNVYVEILKWLVLIGCYGE